MKCIDIIIVSTVEYLYHALISHGSSSEIINMQTTANKDIKAYCVVGTFFVMEHYC